MADAPEKLPDAAKGWGVETFALRNPFLFAGVEYRELTIRVPTGYDIEQFVRGTAATVRSLADRLVDADAKVIDALHGADYSRLLKHVGKFIAESS